MKKIIIFTCVLSIIYCFHTNAAELTDLVRINDDLNYTENQVFKKNYKNKDIQTRLDDLETEVYGALQPGDFENRIRKLKRAVTNVSSGGYGLNNLSKITNLAGDVISNYNYYSGYKNRYYNGYYNHNHYGNHFGSHRVYPHHHYHSHRIYPNNYYANSVPDNGDYARNYSIGTSIRILDD